MRNSSRDLTGDMVAPQKPTGTGLYDIDYEFEDIDAALKRMPLGILWGFTCWVSQPAGH